MLYLLTSLLSFWAGTLYADWQQQRRTARLRLAHIGSTVSHALSSL